MPTAWNDHSEEGVTKAVLCTEQCRADFPSQKPWREPTVAVWGNHSPCHSTQTPHSPARERCCSVVFDDLSCEADSHGLLCTPDLLEIDLQERSPETERGKRRALLRGGTRAQMANLVPRGQKREKLARSELKNDLCCTVNSLINILHKA